MGSGGGGSQVIGYRYYVGMHFVPCYGPVDAVKRIVVGEREVWSGNQTDADGSLYINKDNIFGGDHSEGGIRGTVLVRMGNFDQTKSQYLSKHQGSDISAHRGLLSIILHNCYVGNNPYIKPWSFLLQRIHRLTDGKPQWYDEAAAIGQDLNPAHIIRECLVSSQWGIGYSYLELDDAKFRAVADDLKSEELGLSLIWDANQTVEDFIQTVLDHIDGTFYQDPVSGLFVLRLIRPGEESKLTLTEDNCVITDYHREGWGEISNQVTITYTDRDTGDSVPYSLQNTAAVAIEGGVVDKTIKRPGLHEKKPVADVAMRELIQASTPKAYASITADRSAVDLRVGDMVEIVWPDLGLDGLRMRVTEVHYGLATNPEVQLELVEDVFQNDASVFAPPADDSWSNPIQRVTPVTHGVLQNLTYYHVAQAVGDTQAQQIVDEDFARVVTTAAKPQGIAFRYNIDVKPDGGDWKDRGVGHFVPYGKIGTDLGYLDTELQLQAGYTGLDRVEVPVEAVIDDEFVEITGIDPTTGQMSINRGVLDTVPAKHSEGAYMLVFGNNYYAPEVEYVDGETVQGRFIPSNSLGPLPDDEAAVHTLTVDNRAYRPYPVGRFRVDGLAYPTEPYQPVGTVKLEWAHRDRLQETAGLVGEGQGNVGPEQGTTYTVQLIANDGTVLKNISDITDTQYTMDLSDIVSSDTGTVKVISVRDGVNSYQSPSLVISLRPANARELAQGGYRLTAGGAYREVIPDQ